MTAGDTTPGRRVYPSRVDDQGREWFRLKIGDYYRDDRGIWSGVTPNGLHGNLANHTVVEHGDETITVSPSILVNNGAGGKQWHGYLERGIWREV